MTITTINPELSLKAQGAKLDWYEKYYVENFMKYVRPRLELTRFQSIEALVLLFKIVPKVLITTYITELEKAEKIQYLF